MGCRELIASLRAARDEKIIAIWDTAEAAADEARAESRGEMEESRTRLQEEHKAAAEIRAATVLAQASKEARDIRIAAERRLAARLAALAKASLPSLRNEGYEDAFRSLRGELPRLVWRTVKVNPQDQELARNLFPDGSIVTDEAISGGLVASTEGERITVVNSLDARLERAWDELLPHLLAAVYEKTEREKTAGAA